MVDDVMGSHVLSSAHRNEAVSCLGSSGAARRLGTVHPSSCGAAHHLEPLPGGPRGWPLAPVLPEGWAPSRFLIPNPRADMFWTVLMCFCLVKDRCASWCEGCCPDISSASEQCCRWVQMCDCRVPSMNSYWTRDCAVNPVSLFLFQSLFIWLCREWKKEERHLVLLFFCSVWTGTVPARVNLQSATPVTVSALRSGSDRRRWWLLLTD